ncbi:unnamed protein product [Arctogadus glacialis]
MDSLVQPLVAQYLAMGGQSKDNSANGNIPANEGKEKEHPRASRNVRLLICSRPRSSNPPTTHHRHPVRMA